mmetsp:Transcript_14591/g.29560  ORF Transcript_14591/g.29560 Transcript_14591/m.29560 type:complete len:88 (-) Transcript_14591:97-360(-)
MVHARNGCKRPNSKFKLLASLADNIFHTTKAYRILTSKPKAKWFKFSEVERDKISAWSRWRAMKKADLRERAHGGQAAETADTPPLP